VRFARSFGELVKGTEWFGDMVEFPEILPITNRIGEDGVPLGTGGSIEFGWHADYSYVDRVGKESFLDAVELPPEPPQTCFCSQYIALETLPRKTVEALRPLRAFHSLSGFVDGDAIDPDAEVDLDTGFRAKRERDARLGIERPPVPEAVHPVIYAHPDSGRELLYVSPGITRHIVGMPDDESRDLLAELHAHSTRPDFVYRHDWQLGDLVVFDTLGAMHRRDAWSPEEPRFMRQLSTMC
jgi:taurine dioxygenase